MPTTPPKARILLKQNRARVHRLYPFTVQLNYETPHQTQPVEIRIDYGAKTHGIALVQQCRTHDRAIFLGEAKQRQDVKKKMDIRRELRRARRYRKTRYRKPRFYRKRQESWLPPTIRQRIETITRVTKVLQKMTPITSAMAETGTFDTQKIINPEIQDEQQQLGPGHEYENRRHAVLAYFNYACQYCGTTKGIMTEEHVLPKAKGGTDAWSNLTCACRKCNNKKGERTPEEANMPNPQTVNPRNMNFLRFCALVQTGRTKLIEELQKIVPTQTVFGWQTRKNRETAKLAKRHYYDALCTRALDKKLIVTSAMHDIRFRRRNVRQTHLSNTRKGGERQSYNPNKELQGYRKGDLIRTQHGKGYIDAIRTSGQLLYCTVSGQQRHKTVVRKARLLESTKSVQFMPRRVGGGVMS
jgi:hypothetical protein